ncbi:hypothetical protein MMC28_000914 [Mycoblastus sanguinarius]|nr:hypothetical protein [Mycoblastus sanguinarius]
MRPISVLFLNLVLTLLLVRAAGPVLPHVDPDPDPAPDVPNDGPNSDPSTPDIGAPGANIGPIGFTPSESDESDIGEHLSDILDAIQSIISIAAGGSTTVLASSVPPVAYGCLSAESIYSVCSANDTVFNTAATSYQASCLCYRTIGGTPYWAPLAFDGYMSSCNDYVQAAIQYSTNQSGIETAVSVCATGGDVRATPAANATNSGAAQTGSSPTIMTSPTSPPSTGIADRQRRSGGLFMFLGIVLGWAGM